MSETTAASQDIKSGGNVASPSNDAQPSGTAPISVTLIIGPAPVVNVNKTRELDALKEYISQDSYWMVDTKTACCKAITKYLMQTIVSKLGLRYTPGQIEVKLDGSTKTQLLIIVRMIYMTATRDRISNGMNPREIHLKYAVGTIERNFYLWFKHLIAAMGDDWDTIYDVISSEISDEISEMTAEYEDKNGDTSERASYVRFAEVATIFLIGAIADKAIEVFGPRIEIDEEKTVTLKGNEFNTCLRMINSPVQPIGNEIWMIFGKAANQYPEAKKKWRMADKVDRMAKSAAAKAAKKGVKKDAKKKHS